MADEVVDQRIIPVRVRCPLKQRLEGQPVVAILPGPSHDVRLDNPGFDWPVEGSADLLRQDKRDGICAMGFLSHHR